MLFRSIQVNASDLWRLCLHWDRDGVRGNHDRRGHPRSSSPSLPVLRSWCGDVRPDLRLRARVLGRRAAVCQCFCGSNHHWWRIRFHSFICDSCDTPCWAGLIQGAPMYVVGNMLFGVYVYAQRWPAITSTLTFMGYMRVIIRSTSR